MSGIETVTIQRATATVTGRDGTTRPDWTDVTETDVAALVAPSERGEDHGANRQATITSYDLYLPAGTDITAADRVTVRGDTFDVDGEPAVWADSGIVATVKRVAG